LHPKTKDLDISNFSLQQKFEDTEVLFVAGISASDPNLREKTRIQGVVIQRRGEDYANEKGALIRSSAHVVEKQGKIGSGYRSV